MPFYVLSSNSYIKVNVYKFGYSSKSKNELLKQYEKNKRTIPNPFILQWWDEGSLKNEKIIHNILRKMDIIENIDGEWYECDNLFLFLTLINDEIHNIKLNETLEFIQDDINYIDLDIFNYKIYNDYIIIKDLKEIIKKCKESNLGKEKYYTYIDNSPDGKIIDSYLKLYNYNCEKVWNNIIKKNVLNKEGVFKKIYYDYIIGCLDGCDDCDSDEYGECKYNLIIYNYFKNKNKKCRKDLIL